MRPPSSPGPAAGRVPQRGARARTSGPEYRPWALHHGSYSDLLALSGDRYLARRTPGALHRRPHRVPGGPRVPVVAAVVRARRPVRLPPRVVHAPRRLPSSGAGRAAPHPGRQPLVAGRHAGVALYGVLNWDLVGIALLALARSRLGKWVAARARHRHQAVPGRRASRAAGAQVRARGRRWPSPSIVPFAIVARDNWWWFFRFNSRRPPDFSIWNAARTSRPSAPSTCSRSGWLASRPCSRACAPSRFHGVAFVIAVWMATNKVSSPQYSLWVFAAAALVSAPWRIWWALVVASIFDFACELWLYPRHALLLSGPVTVDGRRPHRGDAVARLVVLASPTGRGRAR